MEDQLAIVPDMSIYDISLWSNTWTMGLWIFLAAQLLIWSLIYLPSLYKENALRSLGICYWVINKPNCVLFYMFSLVFCDHTVRPNRRNIWVRYACWRIWVSRSAGSLVDVHHTSHNWLLVRRDSTVWWDCLLGHLSAGCDGIFGIEHYVIWLNPSSMLTPNSILGCYLPCWGNVPSLHIEVEARKDCDHTVSLTYMTWWEDYSD